MTQTTTMRVDGAERAARPAAGTGRRLRRRHLWIVPGLVLAIGANFLGSANGVGIPVLIAFGIAPDVPRLLGRLGLAARPVHDLLHQPVAAVAAVALTATGVVPIVWLVGSLVWVSHVVIGWGVGDVPRRGGAGSHA